MANFDEIARMAREKSQSIVDTALREEQARQEAEVRRLEMAEKVLHDNVLPVLEEARSAFEKDGITLSIDESESFQMLAGSRGEAIKIRKITFGCSSQLETSRTGSKQARGQQFTIEHDGEKIIGKADGVHSIGTKFEGGSFPPFVTPFVSQALESYYSDLRRKT